MWFLPKGWRVYEGRDPEKELRSLQRRFGAIRMRYDRAMKQRAFAKMARLSLFISAAVFTLVFVLTFLFPSSQRNVWQYVMSAAKGAELPPPLCHPFEFFFEVNSAELTPEAHQIIGIAIEEANLVGASDIWIVGMFDVSGPENERPEIGLLRAEAAKEELIRRGTDANAITTSSEETNVGPQDGFEYRYNRRVVIDLHCHT